MMLGAPAVQAHPGVAPPPVSVSFVGAEVSTANSMFNNVVNKPAGVQSGDLILLIVFVPASGSVYAVNTPAGFTSALNVLAGSTGRIQVLQRVADGSEGSSFTVGNQGYGMQRSLACCVYRAATTVATVPSSAATSSTAPSISPTSLGVLLGIFACEATSTEVTGHTPPSGMTAVTQINPTGAHLAVDHLLASPVGATGNKTVTWSPTAAPTEPAAVLIQIA